MPSQQRISSSELRSACTPELMRPMQIIHIALATGVAFFLGVIAFIAQGAGSAKPDVPVAAAPIDLLTMITVGVLAVSFPLSHIVFGSIIKTRIGRLDPPLGPGDIVAIIRTAYIVRSAIMEAAAFFGAVVFFMAVMNGFNGVPQYLWINVVPALVFIIHTLLTLPNPERLVSIYEGVIR